MTKAQLLEDIKFLAERSMGASSITFNSERCTGMSSNAIVSIAYGYGSLENQILPADNSDLRSCENMWKKLPEHRRKGKALKAMEAARNFK